MTKALTAGEVLRQKKKTFPFEGSWKDAFGEPERTGIWFIWGNSGNGKSSFVMQLCKELCKFDRVAYDSLEEGTKLKMQASLQRHGMADCGRRFSLLNDEPMDELKARLDKRKSFNIVVVDSFQYTQMTYSDYKLLNERYRNKLIIFISQATGSQPMGSAAKKVMYSATLKIWVEGFRAFSKGRFFGPKYNEGYTIWEEGAKRYWGK